jgi:hypothetical protein
MVAARINETRRITAWTMVHFPRAMNSLTLAWSRKRGREMGNTFKTIVLAAWMMPGVATLGCAGSFEEARLAGIRTAAPAAPSAASTSHRGVDKETYCRELDDKRISAGARAKGAGLVAGAGGVGASVVAIVENERVSHGVVVGVSVGIAVLAGAAAVYGAHQMFAAESYGVTWARECGR